MVADLSASLNCLTRNMPLRALRPRSNSAMNRRCRVSQEHFRTAAISSTVQPYDAIVSTLCASIATGGLPVLPCPFLSPTFFVAPAPGDFWRGLLREEDDFEGIADVNDTLLSADCRSAGRRARAFQLRRARAIVHQSLAVAPIRTEDDILSFAAFNPLFAGRGSRKTPSERRRFRRKLHEDWTREGTARLSIPAGEQTQEKAAA
jgi:hypothetical protein